MLRQLQATDWELAKSFMNGFGNKLGRVDMGAAFRADSELFLKQAYFGNSGMGLNKVWGSFLVIPKDAPEYKEIPDTVLTNLTFTRMSSTVPVVYFVRMYNDVKVHAEWIGQHDDDLDFEPPSMRSSLFQIMQYYRKEHGVKRFTFAYPKELRDKNSYVKVFQFEDNGYTTCPISGYAVAGYTEAVVPANTRPAFLELYDMVLGSRLWPVDMVIRSWVFLDEKVPVLTDVIDPQT